MGWEGSEALNVLPPVCALSPLLFSLTEVDARPEEAKEEHGLGRDEEPHARHEVLLDHFCVEPLVGLDDDVPPPSNGGSSCGKHARQHHSGAPRDGMEKGGHA